MSMEDPSPRTSRLFLTAGFGAAIAIGALGFAIGQRSATAQSAVAEVPAAAPLPVPAPAEVVRRVLGRQDLVLLAATAADAFARGVDMPADTGAAVGDRFSIALPFGCERPAAADSEAPMRWRYDEAAGALRLNVTPESWSADEWALGDPAAVVTDTGAAVPGASVEGFWLARPWANSEACPAVDTAAEGVFYPVLLPGQTLAIGQIFGDGDSRRDRRAYANVVRMKPESVRGEAGFRVRLKGRIAAAPDGGPVACQQPGGAEQRPICLVLASFDSVAIENGATGETLAIWDVATTGRSGEAVTAAAR